MKLAYILFTCLIASHQSFALTDEAYFSEANEFPAAESTMSNQLPPEEVLEAEAPQRDDEYQLVPNMSVVVPDSSSSKVNGDPTAKLKKGFERLVYLFRRNSSELIQLASENEFIKVQLSQIAKSIELAKKLKEQIGDKLKGFLASDQQGIDKLDQYITDLEEKAKSLKSKQSEIISKGQKLQETLVGRPQDKSKRKRGKIGIMQRIGKRVQRRCGKNPEAQEEVISLLEARRTLYFGTFDGRNKPVLKGSLYKKAENLGRQQGRVLESFANNEGALDELFSTAITAEKPHSSILDTSAKLFSPKNDSEWQRTFDDSVDGRSDELNKAVLCDRIKPEAIREADAKKFIEGICNDDHSPTDENALLARYLISKAFDKQTKLAKTPYFGKKLNVSADIENQNKILSNSEKLRQKLETALKKDAENDVEIVDAFKSCKGRKKNNSEVKERLKHIVEHLASGGENRNIGENPSRRTSTDTHPDERVAIGFFGRSISETSAITRRGSSYSAAQASK